MFSVWCHKCSQCSRWIKCFFLDLTLYCGGRIFRPSLIYLLSFFSFRTAFSSLVSVFKCDRISYGTPTNSPLTRETSVQAGQRRSRSPESWRHTVHRRRICFVLHGKKRNTLTPSNADKWGEQCTRLQIEILMYTGWMRNKGLLNITSGNITTYT